MSDNRLDKLLTLGTSSARLAFTANPPPNVTVLWLETDTGVTYLWDGSAWVLAGHGEKSVTITATGSAAALESIIKVDATAAAVIITLASVSALGAAAFRHTIVRSDAVSGHTVTLAVQSGEYMNAVLNGTATVPISSISTAVAIPADGWFYH